MRNHTGANLDVFETLEKKSAAQAPGSRAPSTIPPPPPPTLRVSGDARNAPKQTFLRLSTPFSQKLPPPPSVRLVQKVAVARPVILPPPPRSTAPASEAIKPRAHPSSLAPVALEPAKPASISQRIEIDGVEPLAPNRDRNRKAFVMGLAIGVAACVAAVLCFLPQAGQIAVNVADSKGSAVPHLSIAIDGKPRCDSAPCIVPDIAPGSHTVKVEASGFEPPADKAVDVESRKDTTVDFSLALTANGGTGLRAIGTQPGVELFVDDKEIGPLPQILHDMAPGGHKVKFAGSERYAPVEKMVMVTQDELQDLGVVTLQVVKGKATFSPQTPGASLFLVSGSDRWVLPALPISVDIDTSKPWSLVASKPGFDDYSQPIRFEDGQAEKAFKVVLEPKTMTSRPSTDLSETNPASPPGATPTSSQGAATGGAFLKINSIPAASITLDGKPIGSTPKLKYRVSPGMHSLVFVNPDQGFEKQISVTVAAGETKAAICRN